MKTWALRIVILACIFATVAMFLRLSHIVSRGGETSPLYSIRRFDPYGAAALHRLLLLQDRQVISLQRPRLEREHQGILLQILPVSSISGDEAVNYSLPTDALLDWVSQGNTLIQMTRRHTPVMEKLEIQFKDDQSPVAFVTQPLEIELAQIKGVFPDKLPGGPAVARWQPAPDQPRQAISLFSPRIFTSPDKESITPLAMWGEDPVALQITHGKGKVILIGDPTMALNHYLGEAQNLPVMLSLLGHDEPIIFDEWAHGVGHAGSIMDVLIRFGLLPVMFQIILIIGVYRWTTLGKTPAPLPLPVRSRSSREQIDTLGHLYQQAWSPNEKLRRVHEEIVHRLSEACRCEPAQLPTHLKAMTTDAASQAAALLAQVRSLAAVVRPLCRKCQFDLTSTTGLHCPECGALIPRSVRRLVDDTALDAHPNPDARWSQRDLARFLTESHRLARELTLG